MADWKQETAADKTGNRAVKKGRLKTGNRTDCKHETGETHGLYTCYCTRGLLTYCTHGLCYCTPGLLTYYCTVYTWFTLLQCTHGLHTFYFTHGLCYCTVYTWFIYILLHMVYVTVHMFHIHFITHMVYLPYYAVVVQSFLTDFSTNTHTHKKKELFLIPKHKGSSN